MGKKRREDKGREGMEGERKAQQGSEGHTFSLPLILNPGFATDKFAVFTQHPYKKVSFIKL